MVSAVLSRAPERRPRVVAVEGRSGSGKSTVAARLAAALDRVGEPSAVLTMEDLYPGWEGLSLAHRFLREWVLEPIARGGRVAWRRYDWELGRFGEGWTPLPPPLADGVGTLVVEGCGCGAAPARPHLDVLVWVAATDAERAGRLDRRGDAALYAPYRALWARQEEEFHAEHRPREHADLVVDNSAAGGPEG
ncbi:phosphoribulokinase [Nocardiopsis sp. NPDC049922]|uniref:uridine kinase family protein n=1 Tax=Nocardiopsis sp. NPDC049922 TaxID=3155157 RepID=UPI00340A934A